MSAPTTVRVQIPLPLRALVDGRSEVEATGSTVGEALRDLDRGRRGPGLTQRILSADGAVRGFVEIFVDDTDIRGLDGLDSSLDGAEVVAITPAGAAPDVRLERHRKSVAHLASRIQNRSKGRGAGRGAGSGRALRR